MLHQKNTRFVDNGQLAQLQNMGLNVVQVSVSNQLTGGDPDGLFEASLALFKLWDQRTLIMCSTGISRAPTVFLLTCYMFKRVRNWQKVEIIAQKIKKL